MTRTGRTLGARERARTALVIAASAVSVGAGFLLRRRKR
jgi:hypothetical protein